MNHALLLAALAGGPAAAVDIQPFDVTRFPRLSNADAWKNLPRQNPKLPNWARMLAASLPRTTASELVVQTVVGSAKLLRETGEHPTVLREQVTSPGGTTAAAIRELEDHKVRAAFLTAMEAARDRSRALAEGVV